MAPVRAGPWVAPMDEVTTVHAYVDHSIVTLIVDNRTALTAWVHPQHPDSTGVGVFSDGGHEGELLSLDVWTLASPGAAD
eukprot:2678967-Prymnesium_polylepis.1